MNIIKINNIFGEVIIIMARAQDEEGWLVTITLINCVGTISTRFAGCKSLAIQLQFFFKDMI